MPQLFLPQAAKQRSPVISAVFATALVTLAAIAVLATTPAPAQAQPSPDLTYRDVVIAQLAGFKANDQNDSGIAIAFNYASPGNRRLTGPVQRFASMIRAGYPDLLNHRSATIVADAADGPQAAVTVVVETPDRRVFRYLFSLSKQASGECTGCWMTDGVLRQEAGGAI